MFAFFAHSRYMPCPECGASLTADDEGDHTCDRERWVEYQLFHLRSEIARFDLQLAAYLDSPTGRFETWYAARQRRAA